MKPRRPPPKDEVHETWIERRLGQALAEGDVSRLPGAGRPLDDIDQPYDPLWWSKKLVQREKLSLTLPAVEIRREVERFLGELPRLGSEPEVRRRVAELNRDIVRVNSTTVVGPATSVAPLDVEKIVERWRRG